MLRRCSFSCFLAVVGVYCQADAQAGFLDPNSFASLGAFPSAPGAYSFDTNTFLGAPRLNLSGGGFISGVFSNGVAVFTFDSINITADITVAISGHNSGNNAVPLALLSRSNILIASNLNLDAQGSFAGAGGYLGAGQGSINQPGSGPGGGSAPGGGGGFGGAGGNSPNATGGKAYGDLATLLQGGSGGANGNNSASIYGGGGGGAIEIGANGNIVIKSQISASGAGGTADYISVSGGGGSGGGILIHGNSVSLDGPSAQLLARGGDGGSIKAPFTAGGGGGGGGRILIATGNGGFLNKGGLLDVSPGSGGSGSFGAANGSQGGNGEIRLISYAVPEPSGLLLFSSASVGLAGLVIVRKFRLL